MPAGSSPFAPFRNFDYDRERQRLLMILPEGQAAGDPAPPAIDIVRNWFEELNERVPVP